MHQDIIDNWYETFFQGINCEIWQKAIPPEITNQEVDFLLSELNSKQGDHILDIPCGNGRHSIELARRGLLVTGIDISETFIQSLKNTIDNEGLKIQAIQADLLKIDLKEKFQGAICLGNSFGYFKFEHMKIFVKTVSDSLEPGARFIINSGMIAESILSNFLHYSRDKSYTFGNITMEVSNYYNTSDSFMVSNLLYTKNGSKEEHAFKHYVFTMGEVKRLLQSFGLLTIAIYGSTDKSEFKLGDQQVYIVAEKE